jgi:hypothetical protein
MASQLQWPSPQPVVAVWLLRSNLLWAVAAGTQVLAAAGVIVATSAIYPRYRAGKSGNIGG